MRKGKILAIVASVVMACGLCGVFAGCGGGNDKEIYVAAHEGAYGKAFWGDIKTAFEEAFKEEGYKVRIEASTTIDKIVKPQIQAGDGSGPDVMYYGSNQSSGLTAELLKSNSVLELTGLLDANVSGESGKLKDKINSGFLVPSVTDPTNTGKTMLLPLFYSVNGLYYNKKLVTDPVSTWAQISQVSPAAGTYGFAYPRGGYMDNAILAGMYTALDAKTNTADFEKYRSFDKSVYENANVKKLFTDLAAINAVFPTGNDFTELTADSTDVNQNTKNFYDGKYMYFPGGSFMKTDAEKANLLNDNSLKDSEVGFMAYPGLNADDERYVVSMPEQVFALNTGNETKQEISKKFISFLYSDTAVKLFAKHNAMIPVNNAAALAKEGGMSDYTLSIFGVVNEANVKPIISSFTTFAVEGYDENFKQAVCFGMDSAMGHRVGAPADLNNNGVQDNKEASTAFKGDADYWIKRIVNLIDKRA